MKRIYLVWMFCALALVQIWVPLSMIARREATLREGTAFKFHTRPVDPYDAFRGKYVRLSFLSNEASTTNAARFSRGDKVYVVVEEDENGWAHFGNVTRERPTEGQYIKTRVLYPNASRKSVMLRMPFDRLYMNENDAPRAERQYWQANRKAREAYALVKVRSGMAVLEDLYIEGVPIMEYLNKASEAKNEE